MSNKDQLFMRRAIELSFENVKKGGGPFGALIVRNREILAESYNLVTVLNDPTAHGKYRPGQGVYRKSPGQ